MAINIFTASGNIGQDITVKYTPSGAAIGEFSLPVKQGYGEHEKTSWVTCKLIGKRAESLSQYLMKGTKVTVSGEFVLEQWEKDGIKNSKPVIIVSSVDLHGSSQGGQQQGQPRQQPQQRPQQQSAPQQQMTNNDDWDDSIPF